MENTTENTTAAKAKNFGHSRFYEILEELAQLHSDKNHDYASGGNPLGNFMRRADLYHRYPGLDLSDPVVVALVDAMKQLDAALWIKSNKHKPKVEGVLERLKDVAVYAVLAMVLEEEKYLKYQDPGKGIFYSTNQESTDSPDSFTDPSDSLTGAPTAPATLAYP